MNYQAIAMWSQVVSSPLFIIVLVIIWVKYIQPAVLAAQEAQNARVAEAERHRDEVKASLELLQQDVARAQTEAEAIRGRVRSQADAERSQLLQDTREAGERQLANAGLELERGRESARKALREELVALALDDARAQASERVNENVDRQLIGSLVGTIAGASNA